MDFGTNVEVAPTAAAMHSRQLATGVGAAMMAGLCWGIIFSVPVLLPAYSPLTLSAGRYLAFGLIVLIPAFLDRRQIAKLNHADWARALELALIGNLLYYMGIAFGAQYAGTPITAAIIGTLPLVITISSNLLDKHILWRRLALPLIVITLGLALIHQREFSNATVSTHSDYLLGIAGAVFALFCWTWYPVRNAAWIAQHPQLRIGTWATAQGLATLPLALIVFLALGFFSNFDAAVNNWPLGPDPWRYITLMATLGLVASWLGTLFWNLASRRLPATLSGQLIVFETLFGLAFAYTLRGEWPDVNSTCGIVLLIIGVIFGIRSLLTRRPMKNQINP